jgi:hypothetical protein
MYGSKTFAGISAVTTGGSVALAQTGLDVGWMVLTSVVLVSSGLTIIRLARSRPSQVTTATQ